jgi:hypothetical protein
MVWGPLGSQNRIKRLSQRLLATLILLPCVVVGIGGFGSLASAYIYGGFGTFLYGLALLGLAGVLLALANKLGNKQYIPPRLTRK